jgi:hypothetical protein
VDGRLDGGADLTDQCKSRSQAADFELLAEFEAVGTSTFGGDGAVEGGHGYFEEERAIHGGSLA